MKKKDDKIKTFCPEPRKSRADTTHVTSIPGFDYHNMCTSLTRTFFFCSSHDYDSSRDILPVKT